MNIKCTGCFEVCVKIKLKCHVTKKKKKKKIHKCLVKKNCNRNVKSDRYERNFNDELVERKQFPGPSNHQSLWSSDFYFMGKKRSLSSEPKIHSTENIYTKWIELRIENCARRNSTKPIYEIWFTINSLLRLNFASNEVTQFTCSFAFHVFVITF